MELGAPRRVGRALSSRLSLGIQHYPKYTSVCGNPLVKPSSEHSHLQVTEQLGFKYRNYASVIGRLVEHFSVALIFNAMEVLHHFAGNSSRELAPVLFPESIFSRGISGFVFVHFF